MKRQLVPERLWKIKQWFTGHSRGLERSTLLEGHGSLQGSRACMMMLPKGS